ncbi:MAG: hypothetical protein A2W52_04085 [Candidatus Taylorbacteria bacterium RIFCSPHIGHO2_02_49_25]|uniref:Peptidase A2 domain-containing protein n=1 Tax=Candidatus Taylorbacteria bacterium RIFCSPHIGHO2_02_49_25 TaxID=1802305 RepID=A0A1G2MHE9_9BACT|nr:MAG: hypothetical protein UY62_C0053G0005 [Parcubacteria group bacterium GW2011_GWF2_50_9]OHA20431.1 MAG: hypothetical protein A2759_02080 [Candidatus Taylorbacteria bacterium RIFCSPHIGHO2_01_FULL_49_60]OHA23325.1 MAG: hypothetical protein A2W52_04085 [Candidatus Taylorbacteria bacterium RIFCSPHIGHO2_02_49_25]OHA35427.1 MAG: hypothetical protein A3B27_02925 [Candidatus Taylorbacteria bacterium RIFCSPLOWO2_01_FULL_50_130]OHA36636.1 MAG: hypothetical protein A2W65_00930 [Candidatus Taylorbacte
MKFKYTRYGQGIFRPVIPIEVIGRQAVPYEVLVDSGADISIFDAEIGTLAGIDVQAGEPSTLVGATGVEEIFYLHTVDLLIGDVKFRTTVGFLPNMTRNGYGVVGQRGFFDKFIVKFDLLKEEVELKNRT